MTIIKAIPPYFLIIAVLTIHCQTATKSSKGNIPTTLINYWTHSYEDDLGNIKAYRPRGFDFPESRGRESLEFKSDGNYIEHKIGPTDRPLPVHGTLKFDSKNKIILFTPNESKQTPWKAEIISIQVDLLKLKRVE